MIMWHKVPFIFHLRARTQMTSFIQGEGGLQIMTEDDGGGGGLAMDDVTFHRCFFDLILIL